LGWDAVGVTGEPNSHKTTLRQVFDRVTPPIKIIGFRTLPFFQKKRSAKPVKIFYLYRAYGFKGGLRWTPPAGPDVRVD